MEMDLAAAWSASNGGRGPEPRVGEDPTGAAWGAALLALREELQSSRRRVEVVGKADEDERREVRDGQTC